MDTALVTGASSGHGLAIARRLVAMGLRVYGLDADFSQCIWKHTEFHQIDCDLFRQEKVALAWKLITEQTPHLSILVHASTPHVPGPLESTHPDDIRRVLEGGIMTPTLLTRYALPRLIRIRGSIIFLSQFHDDALSQTLSSATHTLAQSLYNEVRDTGVKIAHLNLQPNATCDDAGTRHTSIDPELTAESVEHIIRLPSHNNLTSLTLRPQATREEPFKAASTPLLRWGPNEVRLPTPDKFPPEPELIYTPERKRPADAPDPTDEDEDDFEDEDDELDRLIEASRQRLREQARPHERRHQHQPPREEPRKKENQQPSAPSHPQAQHTGDDANRPHRDKKRRRRGGRNRNRNRDREHHRGDQAPQSSQEPDTGQPSAQPSTPQSTSPDQSQAPQSQEPKPAPKYKAIPRPRQDSQDPSTQAQTPPSAEKSQPSEQSSDKPQRQESAPRQDKPSTPSGAEPSPTSEKPAKKAATRKTAKKATSQKPDADKPTADADQPAAKKAAKKAVKKAAARKSSAKKKTSTEIQTDSD